MLLCDVQGVAKRQGLTQVQMQIFVKLLKTENMRISSVSEGTKVIKHRMAYKPILLVLDDVNDLEQLEALAGSPDWFSPGSLIMFTSKDKQLLRSHNVEIYEMEILDDYKALELFSLNEFGKRHPTQDFEELDFRIVKYLQGHPLALKVIGQSLYGKSMHVWNNESDRLQTNPNPDIQQKLCPSFDGLASDQKRMFLDIACALIGENKDFAASVLDSRNCSANAIIEVLIDKSLITVSATNMSLQMHELIQSLAREIVREKLDMPGNQSRLWISLEFHDSLSENKVREEVEVLVVLLKNGQKFTVDGKAFTCMKNLRILKICSPIVEGLWQPYAVNCSGSLDFLSDELRLFYWHRFPFKYLPSDFYPENIVAIDLSYSNIKQLWKTRKSFRRLKIMKLRYCCNLTTTPDFSEITSLELLNLEGCVNLVTVHPLIGMLKKLVNQVPEAFSSRWCTSVCGLKWNQQYLQRSVLLEGLHMLKSLNLGFCDLKQVPDGLEGLSCLKYLDLKGNNFTSLPGSLSQLSSLKWLIVDGCKKLKVVPELPHSLEIMSASDCTSLCSLTGPISLMTKRSTYLSNCPKLFKNHAFESQGSISETECLYPAVTSQGSTNKFSSFLRYARIKNNTRGFFSMPERSTIENMDIIYGGNSIPNWFTNKSMGNQVKVELPLDWIFSKLRGYGICVVFKRKSNSACFGYSVKNFDGARLGGCNPFYYREYFMGKPIKGDESDMIWLHYTTSELWKLKEAKNFVTYCFYEDEDIDVKKIGVRLVCDEDLDQGGDLSMFEDLPTLSQHGGVLCLFGDYRIDWSW